jgi:hypothetical protein
MKTKSNCPTHERIAMVSLPQSFKSRKSSSCGFYYCTKPLYNLKLCGGGKKAAKPGLENPCL